MLTQKDLLRSNGIEPVTFTLPCVFPNCNEQFTFRAKLYQHIRQHCGLIRTFQCPLCERSCDGMPNLVRHAWSCGGIRPYHCPFRGCEFASAQRQCLKTHLLSKIHQLSTTVFSLDCVTNFQTPLDFVLFQGQNVIGITRCDSWRGLLLSAIRVAGEYSG